MDIEFAEVAGASAYEIEIVSYSGVKHRLLVDAPAYRAEWQGARAVPHPDPHAQLWRVRQLVG